MVDLLPVGVVTLLYSQEYLPGALTIGSQLRRASRADDSCFRTCILVSAELLEPSGTNVEVLEGLFDEVVSVDPSVLITESLLELHSANLQMLNRPELAATFLKLELWKLTQFSKIVYVDCDCLMVTGSFLSDILALTEHQTSMDVAASPDSGWPDMFNSGVLTLVPDHHVYAQLAQLVLTQTSIDGADQGILNQFFNPSCRDRAAESDASSAGWIRLPFTYNVTVPNIGYQNAPAAKFFQDQIRLVHFIGKQKPWVSGSNSSDRYRDEWWRLYLEFLHQQPPRLPQDSGNSDEIRDDPPPSPPHNDTAIVAPPPPQWDATTESPPVGSPSEAAHLPVGAHFEWNLDVDLLEDELPKLRIGPAPIFPWETYRDAVKPERTFPD
ncbi:LADA_0E05226g1_1 [Lachancea dasiensis]|uniref:LADA_0E05226g1_1 n=1 Tax=Lachancea dasiensis TaxID=1072105 RepID=A0A1G4JCK9_9SACH|nr:LADA_0E05226g1_1 [Lachancea dasiensis]